MSKLKTSEMFFGRSSKRLFLISSISSGHNRDAIFNLLKLIQQTPWKSLKPEFRF